MMAGERARSGVRAASRAAAILASAAASWLVVGCSSSGTVSASGGLVGLAGSDGEEVEVYFGCGCFWHMQHGLVVAEMSELRRQNANITARAAYAGGTKVGEGGLLCYHNEEGKADYGELGHAEVVSLRIPSGSFGAFAAAFWELCPGGSREDPQDMGGEYRSLVGLPGGMGSPLLAQLQKGAGSTKLVAGKGDEGDTLSTGQVIVYDLKVFPAHVAEKFHQFHDDMIQKYGEDYNSLRRFAQETSCPGDQLTPLFQ